MTTKSSDLKRKMLSGLFWSAVERFVQQGIQVVISIIIARILMPADYGLVGMLAIFIAIAQSFINSGFGQALIQKKDATKIDFSTIFYFNLAVGLFFYAILFFSAPLIADFYNQPLLIPLTRFMALNLIINSFSLVQNTILTKNIDFKALTKVSLLSIIISGAIGITMAYRGFGVWSLAVQVIGANIVRTLFLWIFNKWRPSFQFSFVSLRSLFAYGSKLLASGLLNQIFDNIYKLVIGKGYSATALGFYTQAKRIQEIPVLSTVSILQRVTFPVYSTIQDDTQRLKRAYRKTIKAIIFFNFPLMVALLVIAHSLIKVLLTDKWMPSVIYLQLLCISGFLYPLSAVNLNVLKVRGRTDIFFYLEVAKKVLIAVAIIITFKLGILALVIGQVCTNFLCFFINIYYSGREINYSLGEQLQDIAPYFGAVLIMGVCMFLPGLFLGCEPIIKLITQVSVGIFVYYIVSRALKLEAYNDAISLLRDNPITKKRVARRSNYDS
jgi:O-antigen/teichoic acid export membrane protein